MRKAAPRSPERPFKVGVEQLSLHWLWGCRDEGGAVHPLSELSEELCVLLSWHCQCPETSAQSGVQDMLCTDRLQKAENKEALLDFRGSELTWTQAKTCSWERKGFSDFVGSWNAKAQSTEGVLEGRAGRSLRSDDCCLTTPPLPWTNPVPGLR